VAVTTQPARWSSDTPLLLWEAFVSGNAKTDRGPNGHIADARAAARAFAARSARLDELGDVHVGDHGSFNLASAAAMQAGLTIDLDEIRATVLVVAARAP